LFWPGRSSASTRSELKHLTPESAAEQIKGKRLLAMTGAGLSVNSGIPDFRSDGGLWTRFPPAEYGTRQAFRKDPAKVWGMLSALYETIDAAEPNAGHVALADLEQAGALMGVVTQNVDGLHRKAGSHRILRLHGNAHILRCMGCGDRVDAPAAPRCEKCASWRVPEIVFFGDPMPPGVMEEAATMLKHAGALLLIGTASEVWPATELPVQAVAAGLPVLEFNLHSTTLGVRLDLPLVKGDASLTLPAFAKALLG
jgi:NAD-dependent deacetylase